MTKILLGAAMPLALFAVSVTPAFAAQKVNVENIQGNDSHTTIVSFDVYTVGGNSIANDGVTIPFSSFTDFASREAAAESALLTYGSVHGYTYGASDIIWPYYNQSAVAAQIATATSSLPLPVAMSFGTTTRSLNSAFQVSSGRASIVSYTVDVASGLTLTGGNAGTVTLQYADDSGFTTNVTTVQSSTNGNTGTLTIGLATTQIVSATITGVIPAGKYVKIVTANTTGTPTFTYRAGAEVLLGSN